MHCARDIAPTTEGSVRPDLPYYSDTTEHAFRSTPLLFIL